MNRNKETEILCLDRIVSELVWLCVQRKKFEILFENEKNRNELHKAASQFFYELNLMMIYDMNLMISRLTDPYDDKNQNLTLAYFLESEFIGEKEKFKEIYKDILTFRSKIIKARNKNISHNDINTLLKQKTYAQFDLGEDVRYIENMKEFLNIVSRELKGSIFGDIVTTCPGDAYDLLKVIKYGNCVRKHWSSKLNREKVRFIIMECMK